MAQRVVFVRTLGAKYTDAGANMHVIAMKAHIFTVCVRKLKNNREITKPPKSIRKKIAKEDEDAITSWEDVKSVFSDTTTSKLVKLMLDNDIEPLKCSEAELRTFVFEKLTTSQKIQTSTKLISTLRGLFRKIGREHSWEHRQDILWNYENIGNSGNPVTRATQDALVNKTKKRAREEDTDPRSDKHSAPVSAPTGFIVVIHFLAQLFKKLQRFTNDSRPIVNLANLVMLYGVLLHEACRPGDVTAHMTYSDIYFPLHEPVSILAFVLMSPDTIRFLVTNNILTHYVIRSYKGKQQRALLPRLKAVVPYPHNAIDLPMIMITALKCIFYAKTKGSHPDNELSTKIFKDKLNTTALRARQSNMKNFTFYSFRYGAAEEDKKYSIDPAWTRKRMGHTPVSNMKDKYAANKNSRVAIDDDELPLGIDVEATPSDNITIKLEMRTIESSGLVYNTDWLDKAFTTNTTARKDFEDAAKLADAFLKDPTTNIMDYFNASHTSIEQLTDTPMGFHIAFKEGMVPGSLDKLYQDAKAIIGDTSETPSYTPELWSFPQILYGNWRGLLNKDIMPAPRVVKQQKPAAPTPTPEPTTHSEPDPESESESDEEWDDGFILSDIEPGNYVVIYCSTPKDKSSLKIGDDRYIWLAKCVNIKFMKTKTVMTARLMFNKEHNPLLTMQENKKTESITITPRSVINVYCDEVLTKLEQSDLDELNEFLDRHD